ncbi:DPH4 homolog [Mercenaria mercenaria]|uniref:DPH4 homolog n=1 Tax=Mercenaria mercenaria TaxID=6596 RepID=UPI00234FAF2F|nr:DPH4 homolog [Mercenaria mercenaria]XP_045172515.2 DPH4 homolog [Mercenaria mercenaria]
MENLYRILNCNETASMQELKKSYQVLALKHHPDKATPSQSGDRYREKFIKINNAWTILRDSRLREQYDAKWKERCLAQTYPIQDTVDFEEFEKIEACGTDISEGVLQKAENVDAESGLSKGDNCAMAVGNDHTAGLIGEESYENRESYNLTEGRVECSEKDETGLPGKQQENERAHVTELPPLTDDEIGYTYNCRCGGSYILTGVDVKLKFDIVCCDTCSLSIKVIYDDDDDDDDDDTKRCSTKLLRKS